MKRVTVVLCFFTFVSCQDKVICPAFQSTYILDDSTRNAYFSYVWQLDENTRTQFLAQQTSGGDGEDSIGVVAQPKTDYYAYAGEKVVPWRIPKRTKYGIVKNVFYPVKNYQLRTAPMENVLAPEPITNEFVASDFSDSLAVDTTAIASTDSLAEETQTAASNAESEEEEVRFLYGYQPDDIFNVEQLYYNKYFAEKLIDNRPRPEPEPVLADSLSGEQPADSTEVGDKKPFFKGLFKKKNKQDAPEEQTEDASSEEGIVEEEEEGGG